MNDTAARHAHAAAEFTKRVDAVTNWAAPTPVPEWRAVDVVDHLISWSAALTGLQKPSIPVADDPAAAWKEHVATVQAVLDDPQAAARVLDSPHFGQKPVGDVLRDFYLGDIFMHTWDLARSNDLDDNIDPDQAAEMLAGMEQAEDFLRGSGQFGTRQPVTENHTAAEKLMAFVGRDPNWRPAATDLAGRPD